MFSKLKWLFLIQLLLTEQSLCRVPPPPPKTDNLLQTTPASEDAEQKQDIQVLLGSSPQPDKSEPTSTRSQNVEKIRSAQLATWTISATLQGQIRDHLQIRGNVSCEELLYASAVDDPLSSVFPQELMGLSLVPVLVASGCPQEAQLLVLKLYDLLGKADTEELLMDLVALIERKMSRSTSASTSALFQSSGQRMKRSPQRSCINKDEERVYNVVEWIPAVSTLYSLGTAVYYASINCSATAKERAILSAVDLGTDALMVATGGTVGVAGYAVGAGVKTGVKAGVKYLMNSMKAEDDVLVNQSSLERGTFTAEKHVEKGFLFKI
uniref:Apolipoprotein F n=1 Tax=Xiphophorus couchianus TaxID=32473 RepID=A0A3B5MRB2_9TELE